MSLPTFLRRVVEILGEAGVPYMLTGSLAAAFYATPRATRDIDLVIDVEESGLERVVKGLSQAGFYVSRTAAFEALRARGQFNAIDPESGWKADLIVQKDRPFSRTEFRRREEVSLLGVRVSLASLEDILIAKLEWAGLGDSGLQRADIVQLLERSGDRLDMDYLEGWIRELGLEAEWESARDRARGDRP